MGKKNVSPFTPLADLFVKLQKVYKDVYFFRGVYCIPGVEDATGVVGDILCVLEPKYRDAVKMLFPEEECIYVTSTKELKEDLQQKIKDEVTFDEGIDKKTLYGDFIKTYEGDQKQEKVNLCTSFVDKIEKRVFTDDTERVWDCLGSNPELISAFFTDKRVFNYPIVTKERQEPEEYVTIAKQMIPLVSESNIGVSFISIEKSEEQPELYEILIDFRFSHFRMNALYYVLPLPIL